ncbi:family 2A encapsulin nanocompartment cargo protein cysteine desulfurase [Rhodobacter capsulatus]|uniref:cysteine desulfurase n=1 Tax=Rhodobacter capsulatus (strain ATCC BAA-309 / NBRC 16581 / SB1003) TaxID=272942 RepID=D5AKY4_RHOCB|nr:family 2A encapsulin nanocompartment cargo protein cysteine desulfurase [Rhodobacter capsulatus]ADE85974.1 cysteine desulfurase-2 [Rhodobacter capsulatus SB 1003]ETD01073.1 cysteine desulfurase [Rhodobacter capsulatus DE442]ETD75658.1 cysteine desulfurase [Rhodobacter capsulatus R121]ETE53290.1 cysteine desulfurase [Rhodobacter capsulatus Y262]MDS0927810.1 family 2A encapsulin nanocompartment cargo protein cysteine desulfurase [Rhodobacter capsulatus]
MTTPTLTAESAAPAGLPDIAQLTALARDFFTALPGEGGESPSYLAEPDAGTAGALARRATGGHPGASGPAADLAPGAGLAPGALGTAPLGAGHADSLDSLARQAFGLLTGKSAAQAPDRSGAPRLAPQDTAPAALQTPPAHARLAPAPASPRIGAPPFATPQAAPPGRFYFLPEAAEPPPATPAAAPAFDVQAVRRDFPILSERVNGRQLVWFDNAATTQKPACVIDRLSEFYRHENSNIHRAAHTLAARATDAYEHARDAVRDFLGAAASEEITFVRGATEGINLVARTWGVANIRAGDEIIVSHLEHHANIVPWQQLAAEKGARIRVIPVDDTGQVRLEDYLKLLCPRTKIVAVTQVSNALGTVVPVREIVAAAHGVGAVALVDGAQSVSHMPVNVQEIGADFFVFSGHKVFGPTGIGAVYIRRALAETLPPWQGGGNMIADVSFERTLYQPPPARFEAGTGNIADAAGLAAALAYVQRIGLDAIGAYEHALLDYATAQLAQVRGVRLIGTAAHKASVLSFVLEGFEPLEVGRALDREGIAVRAGHHCAQPILRRFGLEATVRPSLAFYNTRDEVDLFVAAVARLASRRR